MKLEIEKSEYTTKKGLCDVKGCKAIKGDFYATKGKETMYDEVLFLCKKHAKEVLKWNMKI